MRFIPQRVSSAAGAVTAARTARRAPAAGIAAALLLAAAGASGATITFNNLISGVTSYGFDGDGDGINDVTFSTTDPSGFRTIGPGLNQSYISEPGLEGTSLLSPDLRVTFNVRPTGTLSFGFALNSLSASSLYTANFKVYDVNNVLLGQSTVAGAYTTSPTGLSSFPEGRLQVTFGGAAAYGLFDFSSEFGRYIIDDFTGNFGSLPVPEPGTSAMWLAGLGLLGVQARRSRRRAAGDRVTPSVG